MFDNIAPEYDRLNHILSLNIDKRWRTKAVRELADEPRPLKVLDVACGTGDLYLGNMQNVCLYKKIIGHFFSPRTHHLMNGMRLSNS